MVELEAPVSPFAHLGPERGAVPRHLRAFGHDIDEPAGRTEAEEDGVGSAREFEALGIVGVDGDARFKKIYGGARGESAHADAGVAQIAAAEERGAGVGRGIEHVHLHVRRVADDVGQRGRAEVGEKFRCKDHDGRRRVLEAAVEPAAGHGVAGLVADIFFACDLEG